jgi:hypothetical protein
MSKEGKNAEGKNAEKEILLKNLSDNFFRLHILIV